MRICGVVALAVLVIGAVVYGVAIRSYVYPTGSMAPTLLGDHFDMTCKTCGYTFSVAKREGEIGRDGEHVEFRCPLCGTEAPDNAGTFFSRDVRTGSHFLVSALDRKPARWDVIVFKYPPAPELKTFVKRAVGLPGETIRVDARGDLLVKAPGAASFVVARKPPLVQEGLWMPVFDARFRDKRKPEWKAADERWEAREDLLAKRGQGETSIAYANEIRDHHGYNPSTSRPWGHNLVGDSRVRARVTPDADAKAIRLAHVENGRRIVADFAVGAGDVALIDSDEVARAKGVPLRVGEASEIALAYADEHVTVSVNGAAVLEWDDPKAAAQTDSSTVELGCVGPGGARFADVRVDRDLYYTSAGSFDPSTTEVVVPNDGYFVLGDNSPNSQDSRVFGFVPADNLMGRAFLEFGARTGWVH